MKKFQLFSWVLVAFLAFQFTACEDEPLEGEFPQPTGNNAEEGQFIATVAGESFIADNTEASISTENTLIISGNKASTNEEITIIVENVAVGTFNITAGTGNQNTGIYVDNDETAFPYISAGILGGSGQLVITEIDADVSTITGTFSFVGIRIAVDENGNPVVDGNGNPVIETIDITNGAFNSIPFTGGGGGGGGDPSADTFFAKVDGVDFVPELLTAMRPVIGNEAMVSIVAMNAEGDQLRIDIPESLGTGTFAMEPISDGTKLIGQYNSAGPGESLSSDPGTITITNFDILAGFIEATFSFTARDPLGEDPTVVEITEGNFSISYPPGATNTANILTTDVGGVEMIADFVDATEFDLEGVQTVTVRGFKSETGQRVEITFPKDIIPGSYDFVSEIIPGESIARYRPTVTGDIFTSTDGSIIVLSNNLATGGMIEAAFLFFAEDTTGTNPETYILTNGEFKIEL